MSKPHVHKRKPAAFSLDDPDVQVETLEPETADTPRGSHAATPPEVPVSQGEVTVKPAVLPSPRTFKWGSLFLTALMSLLSLGIGLYVTELIEALFARHAVLGWAAIAITTLAIAAALVLALREILALSRLRQLSHIRQTAERALTHNERDYSLAVRTDLRKLYAERPGLAWAFARLAEHDSEVMDPADRIKLIDRELMAPLDQEARSIIASAAKRVSLITALNPAALFDLVFVAAQNLTMLRRLAALYGGRPGSLGTFKLARMVVTHLAVTGGLAISDTLMQHLLGRGLAGRVSAKLGEGTVNGIMTARVGLAAQDLCRPLPFSARPQPKLRDLVGALFSSRETNQQDEVEQ